MVWNLPNNKKEEHEITQLRLCGRMNYEVLNNRGEEFSYLWTGDSLCTILPLAFAPRFRCVSFFLSFLGLKGQSPVQ